MAWGFLDTHLSTPSMGQGWGQERIGSEQTETPLKVGRLEFAQQWPPNWGTRAKKERETRQSAEAWEENMKMPIYIYAYIYSSF